ncbi:MAG TPA: DMT family transporter [Chthoniobacter sp.]|nr:DMT family transporter [Chthoniobacter sp.]
MFLSRLVFLTSAAMLSFAANSLLCRLALKHTGIDAASFTTVRLVAGALMLWAVARFTRRGKEAGRGNWISAVALFVYAIGFSFAYASLPAGTGALVLIAAVQVTMISYGLAKGERFSGAQTLGLAIAVTGLVGLFLPGVSAPPLLGSLLMLSAGVGWGVYSIRGRGAAHPIDVTTGNFVRAVPIAIGASLLLRSHASFDLAGVVYAILSGALTSGLGYVIWYTALPWLKTTTASTAQLSVPVLTALGGILFLGETLTLRLALASAAILSGIALVVLTRRR